MSPGISKKLEPEEEQVLPPEMSGTTPSDHRAIFGALIDAMGRPPEGGESARWGRVAKLMAAEGVVPAEVGVRAQRYRERWPSLPLSPQALWNNWGRFGQVDPEGGIDWSKYEGGRDEAR